MPAQPPFLTPTRTPTTGFTAFAITYLMRSAAASVSLITCGRGRGLAISDSSVALNVGSSGARRNSPHVEHGAGLVRHPARVPGRIPDDVNLDRADSGDARYRILHHDRQLLRRWAIWRGQCHVDRHRAVVGDIDAVDQADLVDIGGDFRIVDRLQRRDDVVGEPRDFGL